MRKSTRLSAIGLVQAPEPKKPFSTRFSLRSFAKRVQLLTPEQRSAISRTGFGNLLSVPNHCLNKVFLTELMEAWSSGSRAFVLHSGGEIRMTPLDAALILGLPVTGNPVNLTEQEPFSDLEESYGATKVKRKVAMSFLENRLDSIGDAVSDDFVRSFLLYTIGTFLASNDGKVDSRYLRFLGDVGEVSGFAWGAAVIDDLCQWLDKRKEQNVQYVGGCLIFLQTWSYEHFDVAARPQLQDHDFTFPRMCRWDNIKSNQRQQGTSWFKELDDDQVIWKLQPTAGELQIEIIKEALELIGDNKELRSAESRSTCTPSSVSDVDSGCRHSINGEVCREDEDNMENQVVEDTPTRSSTSHEKCKKQINLGNLVVLDTPPSLIICDKVRGEQEMDPENLVVVEDPPTIISIPDEVGGHTEFNGEELIVMDTPPDLTICDKVRREQEINLEKLKMVVEDTPPTSSFSDELSGDQEFKCEKLFVEDSPAKLSFYDDDVIRQKNVTLQEENTELKVKLDQLMEENELIRTQILSNIQFEEQNAELKKELDLLREENRILRLSLSSFLDRMDRHILDFESNATE
ncbi:protein MAINTENANCE OF MERISTEMS-like isoform X2 [Vigna unguiculata]|uniref:protein MAINTENANCE OF MERISTEMS-like isoform X2 n=1 Tax=Vigna unguiculata TaxID=3917 RepID=UPI0010171FA5|nr:protein MAINTENANCE OF MERISTEMS-like isoform X2 [Vigna unguiculata]